MARQQKKEGTVKRTAGTEKDSHVEDPAANESSQSGGYPPRIGEENHGIDKNDSGNETEG